MERLDYTKLKRKYTKEELGFNTTAEIDEYSGLIGQERAEDSLTFGLKMKTKGYNIYVSGMPGTGKTDFSYKYAEEIAKTEPAPNDLCYVYNFKNPKEPKKIFLLNGEGKIFKDDMEELINTIKNELPKIFSSNDYESKKNDIAKDYQSQRDVMLKVISSEARARDFEVKSTREGMYFVPVIDGKILNEEQYDSLSEEEKDTIEKTTEEIHEKVYDVMKDLRVLDQKIKKELNDVEFTEILFAISHYIGVFLKKYSENEEIREYLLDMKEDILDNIDSFGVDNNQEDESLQGMFPWYPKKNTDDVLARYRVNLLVDNSELTHAPVIIGHNPIYTNLVGEMEYDSEYGNLSTDFMKIKPGLFHKANGGYLILQAFDLLTHAYSWETVRRVLYERKMTVEPLKEYSSGLLINHVKPESIDLDVKVIVAGTNYYYELLNYNDEEFRNLFKIKANFSYDMKSNQDNISKITGFIKRFINKNNTMDFDVEAVIKIIEQMEKMAENQKKLSTDFNYLEEILAESHAWAKINENEIIKASDVDKAINEKYKRNSMYEDVLNEMVEENILMISTEGKKVGQINGLCVIDMGEFAFGRPTRITATTCLGKAGVVDIENESDMSGNIHDKGVQVLTGFLGHKYAQDFPLSLSCRICFEQNYNGIDGDSASSAEVYAIISSIARIPINQEIAVTGSLNQFGEIQAIGGVTQKIEGFFDICKKRNLTGNQGVIIPIQNVNDLVLKDEVIEAVKQKKFHIYPVSNIDDGLEILTGKKAGKLNASGRYEPTSIHGQVYKRLKEYHKNSI